MKKLHHNIEKDKWNRIAGYMEVNERTGKVRKMKLVNDMPIVYTGVEAFTYDKNGNGYKRNPKYDR